MKIELTDLDVMELGSNRISRMKPVVEKILRQANEQKEDEKE